MLGISERFDVRRDFSLRDKLIDFDVSGPVEITPPEAIYESPGGALSEDFAPEVQPTMAPPESIFIEPREYITGIASAMKTRPPSGLIQKMAPTKNFLDIFFDWLNKILSGK